MTMGSLAGYAATAVLACAAGWWMNAPEPAAPSVAAAAASVAARANPTSLPPDNGPLIVIASDGRATLRVEQQPLEWVLEQIALQSGWSDVKQRAGAAPAAVAPVAAAVEPAAACSEARTREQALLQAIERGDEAARHHGLLQARSNGIAVPDAMLKSLFETDASERVRLLAFESYLEPRAGSAQALRSALEAALVVPNAAVQRVARQRLEELLESERIDEASVQRADR